jgi:replicative DNA helicase
MAQAENVCIVLLAQLNRDCEQAKDKRPQLHNLRESGSIEQDADEVLFLLRKEYYWPDEDDVKGMCEIIVSKQRNGPTGSALAAFRAFCTRFDDLETDQEDGEGSDYFESLDKWNDIPRGSRKKR